MSSSSSCMSTSATSVAIYCPKIRSSRSRIRNGFIFSSSPPIPSTWHCWVKTRSSSYSNLSSTVSVTKLFLKFPSNRSLRRRPPPPRPVMEWQDCTVKMEVDVPASVAYKCYADREAIAQWMPFISSVEVLEDKPDLSRWSLKYKAFGRDIEFSWIARNMQPIPNQKIHWRSMEGLPNRGAVRFYPKGPSSCIIELTVSYEVPQILTPVASALLPFLEGLLLRGLEKFAAFAKTYQ